MKVMKCGHTANAKKLGTKEPVCLICLGRTKDAEIVDREATGTEGLEGRKARCPYCGKERDSKWELPFFDYKSKEENDSYYCGCRGWD